MERTERSREFHVYGAAWEKPRVVICNETRGTDNRCELGDRNRRNRTASSTEEQGVRLFCSTL